MSVYIIGAMIGVLMGLLSGLAGIGGGVIAVPCMIYFAKMTPHQAMGTSLAIIIPVAISGAYKHMSNGNVDLRMALCIAATGIVSAYIGAMINGCVDGVTLKRLLGIIMLAVGIKMLFFSGETKPEAAATVTADTPAAPEAPSGK